MKKKIIDLELMIKFYYEDKRSYKWIADYFGFKSCCPIFKRFKALGLKARSKSELFSGNNNNMYGKKHSEETKLKISKSRKGISCNRGETNANWKGNDVKYKTLHVWVKRHKPKPQHCECCRTNEPYDLANISGEYKRDINDFEWLCRRCHMIKDGRLEKFKKIGRKK